MGDKAGFYPVRIAVTNPSPTARTVKLACLGRPVNSQPCAIERTLRMRSVAGGLIWYNTGMVDVCELAWTPLFGAAYL